MDRNAVVDTLTRLAVEAGGLILDVYEGPEFEAATKDDGSPVTIADERADAHISKGLLEAFPGVALVTEEQVETQGAAARKFFIVDPLDGTKEFVQRRGDFTVNIALVEDGRPVLGVVYAPAKGRLFRTLAGGGAEEISVARDGTLGGEATALRVSAPGETLRVVASKSHRDQATDDYIARYPVGDFLSAGSSLKFCLVAAGEADFYPRLGRTMEWDTAAGHAVLAAAGGHVDRLDGAGPLLYGKDGWDNPFFAAYAPGVEVLPL
ncbi:MAG: 3'(2'),5'-bisphosphate nucleotidase CysQ [Pseudomonadota bacterium]